MICSETGLVPDEHCTNLVMDQFIPLVSSAKKCDNTREIIVSANNRISYCKSCMPENGYKKRNFKIIPPEMQSYFDENRISYEKIPPHYPGCEKIFREGSPVITFPVNNAEYLISKTEPEPLHLSCSAGNEVSRVYWYINNKFYISAQAGTSQFFIPEEGPVKISCTDDKGRNRDIWIRVRYVHL
jgi:penicillin-binding protein 1C